ncbi:AAA family ATPase [Thermopolyspora sp. NPDC052614]|uniref:AAA family ATPase n=1 Tax=Thermopolyspora sp. NPDC052614 TaxID=3155682 RepID=UPI00343C9FE3
MRLHRLRLTAFGSFPGEEEVDFDALGAAGLFLVHGPTGAGKTTVLDAVCYALYGRVPGHRDNARSLRCDHAPVGRGPSVELEFTLRGRRLRVTRSPAWHRPKLKGEGLIEEKPKVIVAELTGGDWVARTRRLDEAGHLLGGLLGMSAEQFWQVAMLPQGDFAKFLRATGDERRKLLQHLFSVQIFTDVESWLADHRTHTGRERQELAHAVDVIVKRMEEAAGDHLLSSPSTVAEAEPGVALPGTGSPDSAGAGTFGTEAASSGAAEGEPASAVAEAEARVASLGTGSPDSAGAGTFGTEAASSGAVEGEPASAVAEAEAEVTSSPRTTPDFAGVGAFDTALSSSGVPGGESRPIRVPRPGAAGDDLLQGELFAVAASEPRTSGGDGSRNAEESGKDGTEGSSSGYVRAPVDPATDPLGWADVLVARAAARLADATADCAVREATATEAAKRLDGARALAERRRRHAEALARQALLEETAEERSELGTILDEAARADRVFPLIQAVMQRTESAAKAARLAVDALARIPFADVAASGTGPGPMSSAGPDAGSAALGRFGTGEDGGRTPFAYEPEWLSARERERRDEIARLGELRAEERRLEEARAERERVERELTAWAEREQEVTARLDALPEARRANDEELRAARLAAARLPAAEAAYARAVELRRAASVVEQARAALPDGVGELERAARDRLDEIAKLEALRDDEIRLGELESRLAELEAETVALTTQEESARTALAGLPERLAEVNEALAAARNDAARVPAGQSIVDAACARLDAVRRRDELEAELGAAEQERRDATDRAQELRDRFQEIRQARIEGMAAELALHLVPGEPCVVCGSAEHPAPASATSSAATADDEAAAQARYEEADQARQDAEHRCAVLAGQLEQAAAQAEDLTAAEAADALDLAEADLAELLAAAEKEPHLAARADDLQRELNAAEARLREIERLLAEQRAQIAGLTAERDRLATRLKAAQGEDASVTARKDRLTAEADAIRAATEAASRADQARAAYATARATVDDDLADALDQAVPSTLAFGLPEADGRFVHEAHGRGEGDGEGLLQSRGDDRAFGHGRADALGRVHGSAEADGRVVHEAHGRGEGDGEGLLQSQADDQAFGHGRADAFGRVHGSAEADGRGVHEAHGRDEGDGEGLLQSQAADRAFGRALGIVERLREAAAREVELVATAERLEGEAARLGGEAAELARRLAVGRARCDELDAEIGRIGEVLERARGADATIAARLDRLADEAELLREAAEAAGLARTADAELVAARGRAEEAAVEAGFARLADAEAAVRTAEEREAMAERLRGLDAEQAAVALLLADPELVAAAAEPEPDLAALESAHREAVDAHQASVSARDEAGRRHERLVVLRGELDDACARLRPAEDRYDLARRMAELVGGTSADNPMHIRLSAYVLGERLRQVVDAANERLDHMSGGRYLLLYDQRRSAGDRRKSGGGLGLRVLDGWTGVDRDPATLSGGESFISALALALGLADVVTAEAGGVEIGTLFVDEGFGTLDEDTLDGVLDILDGLRSGGRTVGIVSHVAELRTRIQAQLRVDKGRTGSTLRVLAAP